MVRNCGGVGKRIAIGVEGDIWLVIHLMIAGRLHWKARGKHHLAAFDFPSGSLTLTEAGSKRRASLHIVRGDEGLQSLDPGGIDVLACDLAVFRSVLTKENHTLQRALADPRVLSGIGNAYSDEILHAAKLSPLLQTQKLSEEQWQRLFEATQSTLNLWIARLKSADFPEKVTAFRPGHGRSRTLRPLPALAAEREFSASDTPTTRRTIARNVRLRAESSPTVGSRASWEPTGPELWKSSKSPRRPSSDDPRTP